MTVIVQKFGGSSLGDAAAIARCADRVVARHRAGDRIAVVVSAMGRTTDTLVELAREATGRVGGPEYDRLLATGELASCMLMAMAIQARGVEAIGLSGPEAGLRRVKTVGGVAGDPSLEDAGGLSVVAPHRLRRELDRGRVVVVAGFQALDENGRLTTLQRGGSDASAVALAAALATTTSSVGPAECEPVECELLTDVDGVFTADPRLVPEARHIDRIGCDDMLDLALSGAGVVQPHAVRLARDRGVPIVVAGSHSAPGSRLTVVDPGLADRHAVVGCALKTDLCRVRVTGRCDRGRHVAHLVRAFGPYAVRLDTLVHAHTGGAMSASLVVPVDELDDVTQRAHEAARCLERGRVDVRTSLSRVTLVGSAVGRTGDLVPEILTALDGDGIDIAVVTTAPTALGLLVAADDAERAIRAMHRAAGLDRLPRTVEPSRPRSQRAPGDPAQASGAHQGVGS